MDSHKIIVCSLPNYEDLVAEIYIADVFSGLLSQEEERGVYKFEPSEDFAMRNYSLDVLEVALQNARSALHKVG